MTMWHKFSGLPSPDPTVIRPQTDVDMALHEHIDWQARRILLLEIEIKRLLLEARQTVPVPEHPPAIFRAVRKPDRQAIGVRTSI